MKAASNLTDQTVLSKIVLKDIHSGVRIAAVKNLTEQTILKMVALKDTVAHVRKASLQNLTDQPTLAIMAKTDEDISIRMIAIKKISDVTQLTETQLNDQLLLYLIAAYSDNDQARNIALEKIENTNRRAKSLEISKHCRLDNHIWEEINNERYSCTEYDGGCYSEVEYEDTIYKCKICDLQKQEQSMNGASPTTFYGKPILEDNL